MPPTKLLFGKNKKPPRWKRGRVKFISMKTSQESKVTPKTKKTKYPAVNPSPTRVFQSTKRVRGSKVPSKIHAKKTQTHSPQRKNKRKTPHILPLREKQHKNNHKRCL